jgi:hypothetical protein
MLSIYSCKCTLPERAVSLNDAVMQEIKNVAKEAGIRDVSVNDKVELLESQSLPLMNEGLAKWTGRRRKKHR